MGTVAIFMEGAKAQSFEVTGVEIEAPLFEELFGDRPTPGTVIERLTSSALNQPSMRSGMPDYG